MDPKEQFERSQFKRYHNYLYKLPEKQVFQIKDESPKRKPEHLASNIRPIRERRSNTKFHVINHMMKSNKNLAEVDNIEKILQDASIQKAANTLFEMSK